MMKGYLLLCISILLLNNTFSQTSVKFKITDSHTGEPLFGATVLLTGTSIGGSSDLNGELVLTDIPEGENEFLCRYIGYQNFTFSISFPRTVEEDYLIKLEKKEEALDEIIVEATRANKSIKDLPTRTEVLTEEINEAASMEPSKISHLITHSTGIQVQTTSASSNGAVVRIQGLNGRYSQILRDGFPLYGGFSGSLDILQIPPLDLRQVEYIKGSASTLYGGGAIGGLVNLLSKKDDRDETLLHLNASHIGARDLNAFFSRRFGKFGITNLATIHLHEAYDADNDGFSDVPEVVKYNFNPKVFFHPNEKSDLYLGATLSGERRMGGHMSLINSDPVDTDHFYYDKQNSERITTQFSAKTKWKEYSSIELKNSISIYNRNIEIRMNQQGNMSLFRGEQVNSFTEIAYSFNKMKHNLITGLNFYTEDFNENVVDSVLKRDQEYLTYGAFINYLLDLNKKLAVETGLRFDRTMARSYDIKYRSESFVLPRLSALYKATKTLSLRLSGGMGYRMPTIFNEEAEPYGYKNIQPVDFKNVDAERSFGSNFDIKYQSASGSDNVLLTLNQLFFYNQIDNPIMLNQDVTNSLFYYNSEAVLNTIGFESQIKLTIWKFTWFLGYTYTEAFYKKDDLTQYLVLNPRHSVKGDLLFVVDGKWRIGWDYEYKSEQLLSSGLNSRSLFTTGVVVERTIGNFVIFLNAENFTDTRQTRYGSIASGPYNTPQFTEIYAPLDGYFFNAGLKIKL